jgi:ABC-2 type transport system ATP-binding protein
MSFTAEERAVAALTLSLAEAGIGITALVPRTATLEELFFRLTEGEEQRPPLRVVEPQRNAA